MKAEEIKQWHDQMIDALKKSYATYAFAVKEIKGWREGYHVKVSDQGGVDVVTMHFESVSTAHGYDGKVGRIQFDNPHKYVGRMPSIRQSKKGFVADRKRMFEKFAEAVRDGKYEAAGKADEVATRAASRKSLLIFWHGFRTRVAAKFPGTKLAEAVKAHELPDTEEMRFYVIGVRSLMLEGVAQFHGEVEAKVELLGNTETVTVTQLIAILEVLGVE